MQRYYVCRAYFKWHGVMYHKGDLLPPEFTHHDKARTIYNSRIGECEVEVEDPSATMSPADNTPVTGGADDKGPSTEDSSVKGTVSAAKFNFTPTTTGTPS